MQKIQKVREAILELLIENRNGISLAQLPQFLKPKLDFKLDLNELGYPKLKDLISSVPQIQIELRAQNHPYAVITKKELDEIINALNELMQEKPEGIVASRAQLMLQNKLGHSIDFKNFGCNDVQDFVAKTGVAEWKYCEPNYTGPIISLDQIYIKPKIPWHTRSKSSGNAKGFLKADAKPFIPEFQPKVKKYSELPSDFSYQESSEQQREAIQQQSQQNENINYYKSNSTVLNNSLTGSNEYLISTSPLYQDQFGQKKSSQIYGTQIFHFKTQSLDFKNFQGFKIGHSQNASLNMENFINYPPPGFNNKQQKYS